MMVIFSQQIQPDQIGGGKYRVPETFLAGETLG